MAEHRRACASCGTTNEEDARFCEGCGGSLGRACETCGAEARATARFCRVCGAPLDGSGPTGADQPGDPSPQDGDRDVRRLGRFDKLRGARRRRDGTRRHRQLPRPRPLDRGAHSGRRHEVHRRRVHGRLGRSEMGPDDPRIAAVISQVPFVDALHANQGTPCRSRTARRGEHR